MATYAKIPEGTYKIHSYADLNRVLDLCGANPDPDTNVLSYHIDGGKNQMECPTFSFNSLSKSHATWDVQHKPESGGFEYYFRAAKPFSNIYTSPVGPGQNVTGNPNERIELKLRETGTVNVYQIVSVVQIGGEDVAFEAPAKEDDPVTFETLISASKEQKWQFEKIGGL